MMNEEELNNLSEEELKEYAEQLEEEQTQKEKERYEEIQGLGYPKAPEQDSIIKFFRDILGFKDISTLSRVGNLDTTELGKMDLSVRGYRTIANFANSQSWNKVSNYFDSKAAIQLETSLSKNAKLIETFVTQIKKQQKINTDSKPQKKGFWGSKKEE